MLKSPIVVDNFQTGIDQSILSGFEDISCIETDTYLGCAMAGYSPQRITALKQDSAPTISSVNTTSNEITLSANPSSNLNNNLLLVRFSGSLPTGLSADTDYFIYYDSSATVFKVYDSYAKAYAHATGTEIDITGTTTGATVTIVNPKKIIHKTKLGAYTFIQDEDGRVWSYQYSSEKPHAVDGNKNSGSSGGPWYYAKGLIVYKGYLLAFTGVAIDALDVSSYSPDATLTWQNQVLDHTSGFAGFMDLMNPLLGKDDIIYWLQRDTSNYSYAIGSLTQASGQVFDPSSAVTYVVNPNALDLPEDPTCLEELDVNLLIGSESGKIYRWNRTNSSYFMPIDVKTKNINNMVNVNNLVYIFSDSNIIYVTNGTSTEKFFTLPGHTINFPTVKPSLGSSVSPLGAVYYYERLYFLVNGLLYSLHTGTKEFKKSVVFTDLGTATPAAVSVWSVEYDGYINYSYSYFRSSTKYGIESITDSSGYYYSSFTPQIISKVYKVGSKRNKHTFQFIEIELLDSITPSSSFGVKVYYRENHSSSWTLISDFTGLGSGKSYNVPFAQTVESIQFKILLSGTTNLSPILKSLIAQ